MSSLHARLAHVIAAVVLATAPAAGADPYGVDKVSTCRNSHTVCEDCEKNQPSPTTGTVCPVGTKSVGTSLVDNIGFEHHHEAWDYVADSSLDGKGCAPCGSRSSQGAGMLPGLMLRRVHRYRFSAFPSSFGPGVYLAYDHHLELNRTDTVTGSGNITYFFTNARGRGNLVQASTLHGDAVKDVICHDKSFATISELRLLDASSTLVTDQALAATAVLRQHDGSRQIFEIIRTSTSPTASQRWGRLLRQEDRNGNAVVISHVFPANATDAAMGGSRAKLWQIATITDAYARVATVTYHPTQVAGRWVVASISLPNAAVVSYGYDANGLSQVTYPDGAVSNIGRSVDAGLQ